MATINLGRIKPVFRGAYSGATAYVVDDIVTSGGSSYICIQAHGAGTQAVTVTAYWSVLASTGTDVGTTITTQGDILYRDGSGLQRLAKGTAAQQLAMNSGATAPEWITASGGGILQIKQLLYTGQHAVNSATYTQVNASFALAITPTDANSKFLLQATIHNSNNNHDVNCVFNWFDSQVGTTDGDELFTDATGGSRQDGFQSASTSYNSGNTGADNHAIWQTNMNLMYTPSTQNTSARTFSICIKRNNNNDSNLINYGQADSGATFNYVSNIVIFEVASSIYS